MTSNSPGRHPRVASGGYYRFEPRHKGGPGQSSSEVVTVTERIPLERRAVWLLGIPTALVLLAAAAMQAYLRLFGHSDVLLATFGLDGEDNVPAFWNSVLLLAIAGVAVLLAVLTPHGARPSARAWLLLAAATTYLAMDEALSIHEQLGRPVGALADRLDLTIPTYAWVIPGAALVVVGLIVAARWFGALPRDVRVGLMLAAAVYLTGALVVETINGALFSAGMGSLYAASTGVEELLEMAGCILAASALLRMVDVDPRTRTTTLRGQHTRAVDDLPADSLVPHR